MKHLLIVLGCLAIPSSLLHAYSNYYYTRNGNFVPLYAFIDEVTDSNADSARSHSELLENMKNRPISKSVRSVYKTSDGKEIAITDVIVIKFKKSVGEGEKHRVINLHRLTPKKIGRLYGTYCVDSESDPLTTSKRIYETGLVEYAYPDFISDTVFHRYMPDDEYFSKQVTCHNTGQVFTDGHYGTADADIDAPEAWNITQGNSSIVVAVIDQGVTSNHPDLPNSRQVRLEGSNFASGEDPDDPSPLNDGNHGNACAGVIAATINNDEGIAGIAPNCKIMPIRVSMSGSSNTDYGDAITLAVDEGAAIISCSWGRTEAPAIFDAIEDAIDNDVVVVIAAGNTANHASSNDGSITFPANAEIEGIITVGASNRYDQQSNYSPNSNTSVTTSDQVIDIVAPSSNYSYNTGLSEGSQMWTLDIPGSDGYNYDYYANEEGYDNIYFSDGAEIPASGTNYLAYTARFGGTSHATPVVAGVAALVLSIDPTLTPSEVFDILTSSANKVGGFSYNGSGWSEEFGYGRVNAFNAVMTACPDNYNIDWDFESDEDLEYQAGNYITAESEIVSGAEIELHAVNYVKLTTGFHAVSGSSFRAYTAACGVVVND